MKTIKMPLPGQPETLHVHLELDGNRIIVDRSECPISIYPYLTNARILRIAADIAAKTPERFEREGK